MREEKLLSIDNTSAMRGPLTYMRQISIGCVAVLVAVFALGVRAHAGNQVLGEIEFKGKTKVERTSGVWVDGNYVGYLQELTGSKKVLLLPGEHEISVRQAGYQDFVQRVQIMPGKKITVQVEMQKVAGARYPSVTSTVKINVNPSRAAVFLDGQFVGHVAEFQGMGRGLLVAPGAHRIQVSLPGYQTFETEIRPLARQKVEVKTNLLKSAGPQPDLSFSSVAPPAERAQRRETKQTAPPPEREEPPPPPDRVLPPPPPPN